MIYAADLNINVLYSFILYSTFGICELHYLPI